MWLIRDAAGRLGHKTLRTLMKRSSLWYLPGVWTSDQWKVPSCCWIQCSLGSRRHTHENKQSYVNPVIIDPLSSSLGNTSHALAPSPSDWLVSQRTVCKMYSIITHAVGWSMNLHVITVKQWIIIGFFLGFSVMPRRIPDFPDSFHSWNFLSSIGSGITFLSFALFSKRSILRSTFMSLIFPFALPPHQLQRLNTCQGNGVGMEMKANELHSDRFRYLGLVQLQRIRNPWKVMVDLELSLNVLSFKPA